MTPHVLPAAGLTTSMRKAILLRVLALSAATALRVPYRAAPARAVAPTRLGAATSLTEDNETPEERRQRLEALGRQAAEDAAYLDSGPADDGGLMAEFNARLDKEGGAEMFKLKTEVTRVGEEARAVTRKATAAGEDVVDAVAGVFSGLTEQQKTVGKIILGLIALQVFLSVLGGSLNGGAGGQYNV